MTDPKEPGSAFPGDRVERGDRRYPTMVRGFNLRFAGDPSYVQVCGDTQQVVDTVQQAVSAGMRITARGGGHCYENFVCDNDGGVIIDLSPMSGVYRDGQDYCVEGGATLWNVYTALYRKYGVTLPAGSCYSVGAGGHVTGGGYGWLSRLHGLIIDYLHAVEVVHVDADKRAHAIVVSRDSSGADECDLMWAHLGGGGGNFGIVTRFWFRDPPCAPTDAWVFSHAWNWRGENAIDEEGFAGLVRRFGDWHKANSGAGSDYSGVFSALHLTQNAAEDSQIVLAGQYVGEHPELLEEFAEAVRGPLPQPAAQTAPVGYHGVIAADPDIRRMPWLFATQTINGSGGNMRGKYKSAYMLEPFPERQIEAMWRHLSAPAKPNPLALLQVDSYGCQINAVHPDATAIPQRSSIMKLQYQTYWKLERDDADNLGWIRDFYEEMYAPRGAPYPDDTMDGCYVNYPDVDLPDWQLLYYKGGYPRLQRAKSRWDPHDVFHHQQSVELPRA